MNKLFLSLVFATVGLSAEAAIQINEIFLNPPGADNGQEFVELRSTTGGVESLSGLTLLGIEGDGTNAGIIDFTLDLGAFSTGSNGLFLQRDAATVFNPVPAPQTVVNVADFNPDIENGSQTFLLVAGFTGLVGQDLDTNDDGTLDVFPWTSVVDAVGFLENDGTANLAYGANLGFVNFGPNAGFNADVLFRDGTDFSWQGTDVVGINPGGPYTADTTAGRSSFTATGAEQVTPGNINPSVVPEPSSVALFATSGLLLLRRRRDNL